MSIVLNTVHCAVYALQEAEAKFPGNSVFYFNKGL